MKICHVTPGLIEIPPKTWGAVEKIIWNLKIQAEKRNIQFDIKYLNDIRKEDEYDIIHIHFANLAEETSKRHIPYYLSIHDHHLMMNNPSLVERYQKVINNSIASFTHCYENFKFLKSPKLFYIPHGVDTNLYKFNKNKFINQNHLKFLCVGNNGLVHDKFFDRKGFLLAAEIMNVFKESKMTFLSPSNSKDFFQKHNDFFSKDNIEIKYDLDENDLIKHYQEADIFIHPSSFEAGAPNLTILEANSCGLPVIGTFEEHNTYKGIIKTERQIEDLVSNINYTIINYDKIRTEIESFIPEYDWDCIFDKINYYYEEKNVFSESLINFYDNIERLETTNILDKDNEFSITFEGYAPKVHITYQKNIDVLTFEEINEKNQVQKIIYSVIFKDGVDWSKIFLKEFCLFRVKYGNKIIYDFSEKIKKQKILYILNKENLWDDLVNLLIKIEEKYLNFYLKYSLHLNIDILINDRELKNKASDMYPRLNIVDKINNQSEYIFVINEKDI